MSAGDVTVTVTFMHDIIIIPTYNITVGSVSNATVTTNVSAAASGDKVTISVSGIASGKTVDSVSVTDSSGNAVSVTTVTANSEYTFTMPPSNVTVTVTLSDIHIIVMYHSVAVSYTGAAAPNGSVSTAVKVNGSAATEVLTGDAVTVTVTIGGEYSDYVSVKSITVKDADGNTVANTLGERSNDIYCFTMPSSDVTVYVDIFVTSHRIDS